VAQRRGSPGYGFERVVAKGLVWLAVPEHKALVPLAAHAMKESLQVC
jgi:hypothetical protein